MIEELNFVKGAVSSKDLVPVLTHFCFADGQVQGGNGKIYMTAPCSAITDDITVPAAKFISAIEACKQEPALGITKGGKLSIKAGSFRALLPLSTEPFPMVKPEGDAFAGGDIVDALTLVRQFVGTDAARPWACGILFKDGYCYATNNVSIVRVPVEWDAPEINLPAYAIDELLRVRQHMDKVQVTDTSITFHFGDRWLRSQLFDLAWPDVDNFFEDLELPPIPDGLEDAIRTVMPFCPDENFRVILTGEHGISTDDGTSSGAVSGIKLPQGKYRAEPLLLALSCADAIDLSPYPSPCPFSSQGGVQGVLVGLRS